MKIKYAKNIVLILVLILGIIFPLGGSASFFSYIIVFIGSLIIGMCYPYLAQLDFGLYHYIIEDPEWAQPIDYRRPLTFAQFLGYLLIFWGGGILIGELIQTFSINVVAVSLMSIGLGVLINIPMAVKNKNFWMRNR